MEFRPDLDLLAYYQQGREHARLDSARGRLEFLRTQEVLRRHLPPPGTVVADVGGGAGQYSLWLAAEGYRVLLRDLMALHIDQAVASASQQGLTLDARVCDARALDMDDDSVDAVLLLGPLYHLTERSHRLIALKEARRIVRPGGIVSVAAIARWAPLLDGILFNRIYRDYPEALGMLGEVETTGVLPPLFPGSFTGFCHRPEELLAEAKEAELEPLDLVSVEGPGAFLLDLEDRWADPADRDVVLDAARRVERVPELLGIGPHLLLTANVPDAGVRP